MAKGEKPVYVVRARQEPDSDYLTTVGSAWKFRKATASFFASTRCRLNGMAVSSSCRRSATMIGSRKRARIRGPKGLLSSRYPICANKGNPVSRY